MNRILVACLAGALAAAPALVVGGRPLAAQERESGPSLPRAVAREVVDLYNAAGTMRVTGALDVASDRDIDGDVAVLSGPVTVAGRIRGRLLAINADVTFRPGARVDGDVTVVGGVVDGRQEARLDGELRIYRQALRYRVEADRLVAEADESGDEPRPWWRRHDRWERHTYTSLSLGSAKTYNRVEGLPIKFGPSITHDFRTGRLRIDARGIFRTAEQFEWDSANVGHDARLELQLGRRAGVRMGGRLYDEVEAVESWQLGEVETGLASFFLHRDYRDYYNRHGGRVYASLLAGRDADVTVSFADERWASRGLRDVWTLFRNGADWRLNPGTDEGRLHVTNATLRIDTRNDEDNPWSGWYLVADYERGSGGFTAFAPVSADLAPPGTPVPGGRDETPGTRSYGRGFFDLRRYNRLSPEARIDLRVVGGGWLHGDPLPLQRRFSVTGPGAMGGFDFRKPVSSTDPGQCIVAGLVPAGSPAQCERFVMGQVELRGDLRFDFFGDGWDDHAHWNGGIDFDGSWVIFADAGRGWLVGDRQADIVYPKGVFPAAGTFLSEIGAGFDFGDSSWGDRGTIGIYAAKSVSSPSQPLNWFVRVRRRF
jgi:hypothetical protein